MYIAEDDGEVDWDFPSFEVSEFIAKFGFSYLALIEKETPTSKKKTEVTFDSPTVLKPMADKSNQIDLPKNGISYGNSSIHDPWHNLEAPLYQSYRLNMLNKFRTKSEVLLGKNYV